MAPEALRKRAAEFGAELELAELAPAWPLGIHAERAELRRPEFSLAIGPLRSIWSGLGGGILSTAQLGSGALELRTDLEGNAGALFASQVPLEAIELRALEGAELRGKLSGAASWLPELRFSTRVAHAQLRLLGGLIVVRADHVSLLGRWGREDGVAHIEELLAIGRASI